MLPEDRALATITATPPNLLPGLVRAVQRDRRRQVVPGRGGGRRDSRHRSGDRRGGGGPAGREDPEGDYVVLAQTVASKLTADARLVDERWGTTIEISCRYDEAGDTERAGPRLRAVRHRRDRQSDAARELDGLARYDGEAGRDDQAAPPVEIRALDIRSSETGRVLLAVSF